MTFLAMIIAVVLLQVWGSASRVHHDEWFARLRSQVTELGMSAEINALISLAVPVLAALFVLSVFEPILMGLGWIATAILLLLYAFGRGDFGLLMDRYRGYCQSGDLEAAYLYVSSELQLVPAAEPLQSVAQEQIQMRRELLYEGYQRWFAVLFYFVLLGPAGALAYRLTQLYGRSTNMKAIERLLFYVDWVPVRLLTIAFSITGDFVASKDALIASLQNTQDEAGYVLYEVGSAALGLGPVGKEAVEGGVEAAQIKALGSLLSRSAATWVALISLVVFVS